MVDELQYQAGLALQEEGRELLDQGNHEEAVQKLEQALRDFERCKPDLNILTYIHLDLAEAYARTGRSAQARAFFTKSKTYGEEADFAEVEELLRSLAETSAPAERGPTRVRHKRFGEGVIADARDAKRLVRFTSGDERWIEIDYLEIL